MGKQLRIPPGQKNLERAEASEHVSKKHHKRLKRGEPATVNVRGIDHGKQLEMEFPDARFVS